MKKILLMLLSLILCVSAGSISVFASEDDDGFSNSYTFMTEEEFNDDFTQFIEQEPQATSWGIKTYFKNLYTYSPVNSQGSCGYVSFIQYLSYFDTFRNDSIIPQVYERSQGNATTVSQALSVSPGVLRQSYPATGLYTHIQNNKSTDFQMQLMDIVNSSMGNPTTNYSFSIGMWNYYRILNSLYSSQNVTFSYYRVSNFGSKPTDSNVISSFDSYVKARLDEGVPVMLHIAKYDETTGVYRNYHSVVAYYYDTNGIHAHFGWGADSTDIVINSSYQITEAGVINWGNVSSSHSNNYLINNEEYCGCGNKYHTHNYSSWQYNDRSSHIEKCECGVTGTTIRAHAIRQSDVGNRYITCIECNYILDMNYDFAIIVSMSNSVKVSKNGSYILSNGIVVLVDSDIDSYLNGTIVFYDKDEIPLNS